MPRGPSPVDKAEAPREMFQVLASDYALCLLTQPGWFAPSIALGPPAIPDSAARILGRKWLAPSDRPADSRLMTTPVIMSRPKSPSHKDACLIQIYPTGLAIGTRYPLNEQNAILGRDDDCDITVYDPSIS